MPALPDVPKVIKVACIHSDTVQNDIVTRFYLQYSGAAPVVGDLSTFNDNVAAAWVADLAAMVQTGTALVEVETIDLTSPSGASLTSAEPNDGSLGGGIIPSSICGVMSYEFTRRYRGGHARGYWPFGDASKFLNEQTWTAAFVTAMQGAIDAFFGSVVGAVWAGGGTLTHVNVSYYKGFTVITNPITGRARNVPTVRVAPVVDTVGSIVARARIGTQRRRLQYGG